MKIIVDIKTVYGNDLVYPVCENAKLFCSIANSKTLSSQTIKSIKSLGFTIEVQQKTL